MKKVSVMWGGLVNWKLLGGIGLIKILCKIEFGRSRVSEVREVIERFCDFFRFFDDWKEMVLDIFLLFFKDFNVRYRVIDVLGYCLVDLVEDVVVGDRVV